MRNIRICFQNLFLQVLSKRVFLPAYCCSVHLVSGVVRDGETNSIQGEVQYNQRSGFGSRAKRNRGGSSYEDWRAQCKLLKFFLLEYNCFSWSWERVVTWKWSSPSPVKWVNKRWKDDTKDSLTKFKFLDFPLLGFWIGYWQFITTLLCKSMITFFFSSFKIELLKAWIDLTSLETCLMNDHCSLYWKLLQFYVLCRSGSVVWKSKAKYIFWCEEIKDIPFHNRTEPCALWWCSHMISITRDMHDNKIAGFLSYPTLTLHASIFQMHAFPFLVNRQTFTVFSVNLGFLKIVRPLLLSSQRWIRDFSGWMPNYPHDHIKLEKNGFLGGTRFYFR